MQNKKVSDLYADTYKATGDIQVATSKTVHQTLEDMIKKDPSLSNKMADGFSSMMLRNRGASETEVQNYKKAANSSSEKTQKKYIAENAKAIEKEERAIAERELGYSLDLSPNYAKRLNEWCKEEADIRYDAYKSYKEQASSAIKGTDSAKSAFYKTAALGRPELQSTKDKLIKELGDKGYGAMTDIAGVGGAGTGRETRQALIVFDTEAKLSKIDSQPIMKYYSSASYSYSDPAAGKYANLLLQ